MAMKILMTNDDGIDAPGLAALYDAVSDMGVVTVIAPESPQSGCSHAATTHRSLHLRAAAPDRFAVDGTPVDCVRLGLSELVVDADWVLAGINRGGNLGVDVLMSGTVAAAREASLLGIRSIALSHYLRQPDVDWKAATRWTRSVVPMLQRRELGPREFWNVNFPDCSGVDSDRPESAAPPGVDCPLDRNPLPMHFERRQETLRYRGDYHARQRDPGSDVSQCFSGNIAITRIPVW